MRIRLLLVLGSVAMFSFACDDSETRDCVDLCREGQAGRCTAITGDCGDFCGALDAVQGPAGCASQRAAYQDCLSGGSNVCINDCDSRESALGTCIGTYCYTHPTDAACVTLNASF
jgi:hypothetical protein